MPKVWRTGEIAVRAAEHFSGWSTRVHFPLIRRKPFAACGGAHGSTPFFLDAEARRETGRGAEESPLSLRASTLSLCASAFEGGIQICSPFMDSRAPNFCRQWPETAVACSTRNAPSASATIRVHLRFLPRYFFFCASVNQSTAPNGFPPPCPPTPVCFAMSRLPASFGAPGLR